MFNWRSRIVLLAALAAGCTGKITGGSQGSSTGAGGGVGSSTGTGSTGIVSTGTGSTGVVGTTGTGSSTGTVGSTTPVVCTPGIPATSQIARLTNTEYDRTIRDLLGVTELQAAANVYPSTLLATDQAGGLTDVGWSAYQSVAEMIASQVMATASLTSNFLKCTPTATGSGATCLHNTIIQFGRRAFRRPLTTDEVAAFDAIVSKGAQITPTGAQSEIAEALLYMFLISPSFLQHAETAGTADSNGHFTLSNFEVASRLSYLLWGTTPDDTLSTAADNSQLTTSAQILAQAQRMIQDPKAHDMVSDFHRFYLIMGTNTRWDQINKNTTLFPAFTTAVVPDMENETQQFFDDVVFKYGGTFQDLFLSPRAYVTAGTAPLLRAQGLQLRNEPDRGRHGPDPAAGVPHPVGVPQRLLVLQQHLADPSRRVHQQTAAGRSHRGSASGRGPDTVADERGSRHRPQGDGRDDLGQRLFVLPSQLHQSAWLRPGGVQHRGHLRRRWIRPSCRRGSRSTPRPT